MPAILNRGGSRISSGSLPGSRSSLGSCGASRRGSTSSSCYGSTFSLRRSSMNTASAQSSLHSPRQAQSLYRHQATQQTSSKQNSVWNVEDQGSATPSLVSSAAGSEYGSSSSSSSSQSSLQQPPSLLGPTGDRYDALQRYYASRRASLQHPTNAHTTSLLPASPTRNYKASRQQHPAILHPTNSLPVLSGNSSFLPAQQINEDDVWGQFVDCHELEEDLARRCKLLSLTRKAPVVSSRRSSIR